MFTKRGRSLKGTTLNILIITSKQINVLGLTFDSKLQWGPHIYTVVTKANRALNAIKLIKKVFNTEELIQLVTSNFYSVLFYNSEVWHLKYLHQNLKSMFLTASAMALRACFNHSDIQLLSYIDLHEMCGRATPDQMQSYKLSLQLYKTFNFMTLTQDWLQINFNGVNMTRQTEFSIKKCNGLKVGWNTLSNRL